ncbi:MAG: hypothetical protein AB1744_11785 [Candidatus Zixiibacteriota bacterium]
MLNGRSVSRLWAAAAVFIATAIFCLAPGGQAQAPRVVLTVPDTLVDPGTPSIWLNIYLSNYFDTIAGFQFVLASERPQLASFDFSGAGFDTAGTLVSGFAYAQAVDRAGDGSELWFRCIANLPFDTVNYLGFPPQQGGIAVRLPVSVAAPGDSTFSSALTIVAPTDFSDPWGNSIGVVTDTVIDTSYYQCQQWIGDSCAEWLEVDPDSAGYDSMSIDTGLVGHLDSSIVILNSGSITVGQGLPCDYDSDGIITVADLVKLVECLFGIPLPPPEECPPCDVDGSGSTNIADVTYLVAYLFQGGPPPQ